MKLRRQPENSSTSKLKYTKSVVLLKIFSLVQVLYESNQNYTQLRNLNIQITTKLNYKNYIQKYNHFCYNQILATDGANFFPDPMRPIFFSRKFLYILSYIVWCFLKNCSTALGIFHSCTIYRNSCIYWSRDPQPMARGPILARECC